MSIDRLHDSKPTADVIRPSKIIVACEVIGIIFGSMKFVFIGAVLYLALRFAL